MRHRAGNDITSDDHTVYFTLMNIMEHSLQRREVPVNVIDCRDPHVLSLGTHLSAFAAFDSANFLRRFLGANIVFPDKEHHVLNKLERMCQH